MSSRQLPLLEVKSFTTKLNLANFSSLVQRWGTTSFQIGPANEWSINLNNNTLLLIVNLNNKSNPAAKFQLSILNEKGEKYTSVTSELVTPASPSYEFHGFLVRDIIVNKANSLLTQDTLKILCEVSFINDSDPSNIVQCHDSKHRKLFEAFGTLFDSKQFSDVALEAGGHEFKAHKAILIARSKVFAAMFQHELEEQKLNRVSITDIKHDVVEEMIRYMYTDKSPNLDAMAESLLEAAEKYDLENLKEMCEESLRNKITIEKAAGTLVVADRHNAKRLKLHTMDYIMTYANQFIETQGWRDMITSHTHLVAEAFSAIAAKHLARSTTN